MRQMTMDSEAIKDIQGIKDSQDVKDFQDIKDIEKIKDDKDIKWVKADMRSNDIREWVIPSQSKLNRIDARSGKNHWPTIILTFWQLFRIAAKSKSNIFI